MVDPKSSFYERRLKPGDLVVVSIDKIQKNYRVKYGTYKVDSENLEALKVLEGPGSEGDLQSLQKFFNSGGKIKDFFPGKEKGDHKNLDGAPK